jgi:hypothetical protein
MESFTKSAQEPKYFDHTTLRQRLSRLTRETLSCSKKLAYHIGAIKYFMCHYNLTRAAALPV